MDILRTRARFRPGLQKFQSTAIPAEKCAQARMDVVDVCVPFLRAVGLEHRGDLESDRVLQIEDDKHRRFRAGADGCDIPVVIEQGGLARGHGVRGIRDTLELAIMSKADLFVYIFIPAR